MTSSTELHRAAHVAFNERDWEGMRSITREDVAYIDHPRDLRISSLEGFLDWLGGWVGGMSDSSITEAHYLDAGDYSIARFRGRGTNDGQLGPANATGRQMDLDFCEILRVEGEQIAAGALYYDQLTLMVQLGVIEAPATT